MQDWLQSHVRALSFFGCAPNAFVIDSLKSGVTKSHLYDPDINPLYAKLAEHYGVAVLPARVRVSHETKPLLKVMYCICNGISLDGCGTGRSSRSTYFDMMIFRAKTGAPLNSTERK